MESTGSPADWCAQASLCAWRGLTPPGAHAAWAADVRPPDGKIVPAWEDLGADDRRAYLLVQMITVALDDSLMPFAGAVTPP